MPDTKARLVTCFKAVFPDLSAAQAETASASAMAAWDSVATVTLAAAVEEEFDLQLEPQDLEKMDSFASVLNLVTQRVATR